MGQKAKTEYDFFPSDNKWDLDQHSYAGADGGALGKNVESMTLQSPRADNPSGGEINIELKAGGRSGDYIKNTARELLAHAGFKDVHFESTHNEGDYRVTLKGVTEKDFLKAATALATDVPDGEHNTHYALLDKAVAGEIVQSELKRLDLSPAAAGLLEVKTDALSPERLQLLGMKEPFAYTDASLGAYPLSPVTAMQEDGTPSASQFVANALFVKTRLHLNDMNPQGVRDALKAANIDFRENRNSHTLSAAAPIDTVAKALGDAGVLPRAFTDHISSVAEQGHKNQNQINAQIASGAPVQRAAAPKV